MKIRTASLFCGGGGEMAGKRLAFEELGVSVNICDSLALNHWELAVLASKRNFPQYRVVQEDIEKVDAHSLGVKHLDMLWASPSCVSFSNARGGVPRSDQQRSHADEVMDRWIAQCLPTVFLMENVKEFCFPAGTLVLTKCGQKPIETVVVGDEVLTHKNRWKKVTATMSKTSPVLHVDSIGNTLLSCTPNHNIYARKRYVRCIPGTGGKHTTELKDPTWVRADSLVENVATMTTYEKLGAGYAVASPRSIPQLPLPAAPDTSVDVWSPAFWLVLGRWLGDGWLRHRRGRVDGLRICDGYHNERSLGEQTRAVKGLTWNRQPRKSAVVYETTCRTVASWVQEHFGEGAYEKKIPTWVYGLPEELRRALLAGYEQSDGHYNKQHRYVASTASKKLAIGIHLLSLSLGASSGVTKASKHYTLNWSWVADRDEQHRYDENHRWSKVRNTSGKSDAVPVYDITVADDHSFIADGLVVHNCNWGPLLRRRKWCTRKRLFGGVYRSIKPKWVKKGQPDPEQLCLFFERFLDKLKHYGYHYEYRVLVAANYGDPTTRERFFLQAVRDGIPIAWPAPTHVKPGLPNSEGLPHWRSAGSIMDWADKGKSIFNRKKPLGRKTLSRLKHGLKHHGLKPYLSYITHSQAMMPTRGIDRPVPTVTCAKGGELALVEPMVMHSTHVGQRRVHPTTEPLPTVTAANRGELALAEPYIVKNFGGGNTSPSKSVQDPVPTVTAKDHNALVEPYMVSLRGTSPSALRSTANSKDKPLPAVSCCNHDALVEPYLVQYYGTGTSAGSEEPLPTVTAKSRHALATLATLPEPREDLPLVLCSDDIDKLTLDTPFTILVEGKRVLVDIRYRMLRPRELARAMGFPDWYRFERADGKKLTATASIRMVGNACPVNTVKELVKCVVKQRPSAYGIGGL